MLTSFLILLVCTQHHRQQSGKASQYGYFEQGCWKEWRSLECTKGCSTEQESSKVIDLSKSLFFISLILQL
jgi:hypothetical protein